MKHTLASAKMVKSLRRQMKSHSTEDQDQSHSTEDQDQGIDDEVDRDGKRSGFM